MCKPLRGRRLLVSIDDLLGAWQVPRFVDPHFRSYRIGRQIAQGTRRIFIDNTRINTNGREQTAQ